MSSIGQVLGREILDSRGNPTVEVEVHLDSGEIGVAIVPSGASVGSFEAVEQRDNDASRYGGKGVLKAIEHVNQQIGPAINGLNSTDQSSIDARLLALDGTADKSKLGANAILGVSLAVLDAAAKFKRIPLYQHVNDLYDNVPMRMPVPLMNLLNGGAHADNSVVFQEFMVVPVGGGSFREALRIGVETFHALKRLLQSMKPKRSTAVGDEGGYAPDLASNYEAIDCLSIAVQDAGYELGKDCLIAIDSAATEFWSESGYAAEIGKPCIDSNAMVDYLADVKRRCPHVISIEDGLSEEAWDDWAEATKRLGESMQLVGDDLFVTNKERLQRGIDEQTANSILVKLNQVGTVSETLDVMRLAHENNYTTIVSHRSGDTEDTKIADIAVGTGAGQIKTGSASRSERIAKYNRLLRIEEQLGEQAFRGAAEFAQFKGT